MLIDYYTTEMRGGDPPAPPPNSYNYHCNYHYLYHYNYDCNYDYHDYLQPPRPPASSHLRGGRGRQRGGPIRGSS